MNSNQLSYFSKLKMYVLRYLYCFFYTIDRKINDFYVSITDGYDSVLNDILFPEKLKKLKKFLNSKQILFISLLIINFYLITCSFNVNYTDISDLWLEYYIKYVVYVVTFITFLLIISNLFVFYIKDESDMFIAKNEGLENHILSRNPEIKNNKCEACDVIRCIRSVHCSLCNRCVSKYEHHSGWFNRCIGSINLFPYLTFLVLFNIYLGLVLVNIILQIFYFGRKHLFYDLANKELIYHLWFWFTIYIFFKITKFTYGFVERGLFENLTFYESLNSKRLPYLWKNIRRDYFNPFDKGFYGNLKELWISFVNKDLTISEKVNINVQNNINLTDRDESDLILNIESKVDISNKNGEKPFEAYISEDGKSIHKQYNGDKEDVLNWNKIKFFTVYDLKNSPFREIVMKQFEKMSQI